MLRRSQVIGLPVLTENDAQRLGTVADLLINARDGRVIGLLLSGGNALKGFQIYPYEEVRAVGSGAVLVRSREALLATRRSAALQRLMARHSEVIGKRLIDRHGNDLGVIDDLAFSPETGQIVGYQISGGFFHDVLEGKNFIPVSAGLKPGEDTVLCSTADEE